MRFRLERDDRGDFCRVFFAGGDESFLIDVADLPALGEREWRPIRFRPTCQYVARCGGGPTILLHRHLLQTPKGMFVDHADGNGFNCRRYNIENVTPAQNNVRKVNDYRRTKSGYRRVYELPNGRYQVIISIKHKATSLGLYDDPVVAAKVGDAKAFELHGRFAMLNFPDDYKVD